MWFLNRISYRLPLKLRVDVQFYFIFYCGDLILCLVASRVVVLHYEWTMYGLTGQRKTMSLFPVLCLT